MGVSVTKGTLADRLADPDGLLMPGEVALIFRVDPKTVGRWIRQGRLGRVVRTPGGHARIRSSAVRAYLEEPPAT